MRGHRCCYGGLKRTLFCAVLCVAAISVAYGQTVDGDAALQQAARFFYEKIQPPGRTVAVFDFTGGDPGDGEDMAEKLRGIFSNDGRLRCIERGTMLDLIHGEQAYSMTGQVDPDAEIRIGHELGAGVILSGALVRQEYGYRITINAIDTNTAARLGQYEGRIRIGFAERMKAWYGENGLVFIGLRSGVGLGIYTPGANALPDSYSGGTTEIVAAKTAVDLALQVSVAPAKFFALQTEAMLVQDGFSLAHTPPMRSRETVRKVEYLSLVTPVLAKFMFKPKIGNFDLLLQGYGGVCFTIPLTPMEASGAAGSF